MNIERIIKNGGIIKWPKKNAEKLTVLHYLYTKFEPDKIYSEKEVNAILDEWHSFEDATMLRRALVDQGFMSRKNDGSEYKLNPKSDIDNINSYKVIG